MKTLRIILADQLSEKITQIKDSSKKFLVKFE